MTPDIAKLWIDAQRQFEQNRWKSAIDACGRLLILAPAFAGAHWILSRSHQALGEFRKAVSHARQAARCLTSDSTVEERLLVSRGLISAGEYRVALDLIGTISHQDLRAARVAQGVAEQLMMLDAPVQGLEWLEVAARARLSNPALAYMRGNANKFIGNMSAAAEAYEDAIGMDEGDGFTHLALATLGLSSGARQRIARLRNCAGKANSAGAAAAMGFALFRELDLVGDIDEAWHALEHALRIQRSQVEHDQERENWIFDQAIANLHGISRPAGSMEFDVTPIFILGMPRSGTTLVERILGNHGEVSTCGELSELRMAYKWCTDYYCPAFLDVTAAGMLGGVDARLLGQAYLQNVRWRTNGRRWFTDKHPGNAILVSLILRALPCARVVWMERDPLEVCFGNLKELFAPGYYGYSYSQSDVANHHWNQSRLLGELLAKADDRVLVVSYENLVRDPAREAVRIQGHCGLTPGRGAEQVARNESQVTTASSVQVRSPIHVGHLEASKPYRPYLGKLSSHLRSNVL